jgi:hypothetical protein
MDNNFNLYCQALLTWMEKCSLLDGASFQFKEETNWENIEVFSINLESSKSLGIIIIYADNHLHFDYLSKTDESLASHNWSEDFQDYDDLKKKIELSLIKYWQ